MKKTEYNQRLRTTVVERLSPKENERSYISIRYNEIKDILNGQTFISGSYGRFTSIHPVNDLDIIYEILSVKRQTEASLREALTNNTIDFQGIIIEVAKRIKTGYEDEKGIKITPQTHSIMIEYSDSEISFDVVPALKTDVDNEYGDSLYLVPEILHASKIKRHTIYEKNLPIDWIKSDPKGYLKEAKELNEKNSDFRKSVKIVKGWRHYCKENNDEFKLKSFHIEQWVCQYFKQNIKATILEVVYQFLFSLDSILKQPSIKDKADNNRFIDEYVKEINNNQTSLIKSKGEAFLFHLEKIGKQFSDFEFQANINKILSSDLYFTRISSEDFLFDFNMAMCAENLDDFIIDGYLGKRDGFRSVWLSAQRYRVNVGRNIYFKLKMKPDNIEHTMWKVKNNGAEASRANALRGEITKNRTRRDPEETRYIGEHYVECYGIENQECVRVHKIPVIIV